jgi:hypothetical protein
MRHPGEEDPEAGPHFEEVVIETRWDEEQEIARVESMPDCRDNEGSEDWNDLGTFLIASEQSHVHVVLQPSVNGDVPGIKEVFW